MKLRRPSPALVVSIIALVVAGGGTATAATLIGSKQIRNSAVNSAKIKNSSVTSADIKNGTIATGDLSKGTLKRIDGGAPTPGGTSASSLEAIRKVGPVGQPANVDVKVATLTIPAGAYVIQAKTTMNGFTGDTNLVEGLINSGGSFGGNCRLDAGGDVDRADSNIVVNNRPTPASMVMQMTRTVGGATEVNLNCAAGVSWTAGNTTIIATKVASVSRTESNG